MLAKVCVRAYRSACVCVRERKERERDLECNGRSRCCSIQGGKAKLTVSQTLSFSLFGPYLPPSTSTLPFSSLSQHLSSCLHLCRAHFRWQEGGREKKGRKGMMGGWWGVGVSRRSIGRGKQKVAQWLHNHSKAAEGGHSSLGEDASPSSSSCSKNPRCYTSKRRRLTARHSNLCNRTVF